MWKRILFCSLVMLLGMTGNAWAQEDLKSDPGYVDLSIIEGWFDSEPKIVVNIKGALLDLVAEASRYEDPELADLLRKLKSVQVRGFGLRWADFQDVERRASALAQRLESDGWDTVLRVHDDDEQVDVYVRVDDGVIAGMVVVVISPDEDESVFVNIVGEINPEQIGRIGRRFDIDPLDDIHVDYRDNN
ncbi:MAG: DUF4252 domain-containing protein [Rhodothermales bacterium]